MSADFDLQALIDHAVSDALQFFWISDEWHVACRIGIPEHADQDITACIYMHHDYLRADIHFNPEKCTVGPEVWSYAGHEVAHLLTRELDNVLSACPGAQKALGVTALEQTTTRLQALWDRHCPYPGDARFKRKR